MALMWSLEPHDAVGHLKVVLAHHHRGDCALVGVELEQVVEAKRVSRSAFITTIGATGFPATATRAGGTKPLVFVEVFDVTPQRSPPPKCLWIMSAL